MALGLREPSPPPIREADVPFVPRAFSVIELEAPADREFRVRDFAKVANRDLRGGGYEVSHATNRLQVTVRSDHGEPAPLAYLSRGSPKLPFDRAPAVGALCLASRDLERHGVRRLPRPRCGSELHFPRKRGMARLDEGPSTRQVVWRRPVLPGTYLRCVVPTLVLLLSGCPGGDDTCVSRDDCAPGNECIDGKCLQLLADASVCLGSQLLCAGVCVDPRRDPANCGSCGVRCQLGQSCVAGACVQGCPPGESECRGLCTDVTSDSANCGSCGAICSADQECVSSVCAASCAALELRCGGLCVDPLVSMSHCGACDRSCSTDEMCSSGSCVPACVPAVPPVEICGDAVDNDCDGTVDSPECGPSLVAWYGFENQVGPIADGSGRGNDGQARNGITRVETGWRGVAIQTDGSVNTRVTIPDSPDFSFGSSLTVEAWFNPTSCGAGSGTLHTVVGMDFIFRIQFGADCRPRSEVYTGGAWRTDTPAVSVVPGRWNHLALVWDGSRIQTYHDALPAGGGAATSGAVADPPSDLHFGAFCSGTTCGDTMVGLIDEVKVWRSARSPAQICDDARGVLDAVRGGCSFD